ncbi:hypothetical protein C8R45DRAFT_1072350 [Mycena sanguinolenta]|nr:hypothetical protein C8R45DRAFT_1072350 [Mycena sanguinolenta]
MPQNAFLRGGAVQDTASMIPTTASATKLMLAVSEAIVTQPTKQDVPIAIPNHVLHETSKSSEMQDTVHVLEGNVSEGVGTCDTRHGVSGRASGFRRALLFNSSGRDPLLFTISEAWLPWRILRLDNIVACGLNVTKLGRRRARSTVSNLDVLGPAPRCRLPAMHAGTSDSQLWLDDCTVQHGTLFAQLRHQFTQLHSRRINCAWHQLVLVFAFPARLHDWAPESFDDYDKICIPPREAVQQAGSQWCVQAGGWTCRVWLSRCNFRCLRGSFCELFPPRHQACDSLHSIILLEIFSIHPFMRALVACTYGPSETRARVAREARFVRAHLDDVG